MREIAAATGGSLIVTSSIEEGVAGADAIYADVWASMGEESLIAERIKILGGYKITEKMMAMTGKPGTIFLHCLPAFHNLETEVARQNPDIQEVEDAVFEGIAIAGLRSGGKSIAHHQGRDGRDPRELTRIVRNRMKRGYDGR